MNVIGIFTRPDSPYWHAWLDGVPKRQAKVSLKPIRIGTTPATKRENKQLAKQAYTALLGDIARQKFTLPSVAKARTFAAHRAWYAEHVSAQKRSVTRELSILKQLGAFFDSDALAAIDQARVREWRTWRLATVSASTIRREEITLKHLIATAVPKYLPASPLRGLAQLRVVGQLDVRILSHDEEDRLLAALLTPEDRALVLTALDTLLRLRDVADLDRSQDKGGYLVSDTKTGPLQIPVSRRLRVALQACRTGTGAYFPSYQGHGNMRVARMFLRACWRAEIPTGRKYGGVSFHCLRHTGASRMLAAGVDVKTVMLIGGWKNLRVLERYLHPTSETLQAAVEAISARPVHVRSTDRQKKPAKPHVSRK